MGSNDTKKIYKLGISDYEYMADKKPPKSIRKYRRKERQSGKKEVKEFLKQFERYKHSS